MRDNAIANTAAQGILLNNAQGAITVQDNTMWQAGGEGVSLSNDRGQVDLLLARNQIVNNGAAVTDSDGVKLSLRNGATGAVTLANNTIKTANGAPD